MHATAPISTDLDDAQKLKIVIVGHVDHGKSTLIGRLLFDTHSLPDGKIEQIQKACAAEGMDFEYAFLLDHDQEVAVLELAGDYDELVAAATRCAPQVVVTDIRMPPSFQDEGIEAANSRPC